MNTSFSLKVTTPCSENFENFSSTEKGGFCDSCKKEVVDFTKMNSHEITHYFQNNSTQNTCGRFKSNQLRTYSRTDSKKRKLSFISGLGLALLSFFSFNKTHAQDVKNQTKTLDKNPSKIQDTAKENKFIIKGTVTENNDPLPGVSVVLEGTNIGVSTDFDGYFEFPEKLKKGDVLVFHFIGFKSKKVVIQNKNSALDVTLKVDLEVDACVLMGEVAVKKPYTSKKQ